MKIYVDKLPKKCEDCCFSETGFVYDDEVRFCKLKPRCMNWIALYDEKRKDCPLQSLADHDKQVRKEVCDNLVEMLTDRAELIDCGGCAEFMFATYDLQESVKEIQGETK